MAGIVPNEVANPSHLDAMPVGRTLPNGTHALVPWFEVPMPELHQKWQCMSSSGIAAKMAHELGRMNDVLSPLEWDGLANRVANSSTLPHQVLACNETWRLDVTDPEARRIANTSSVAFAFLVRDGEAYLERNLAAITQVGEAFRRFWLVFVENDSTDGTRVILHELLKKPYAHGEMLNMVNASSAALCLHNRERRNCGRRISLLARLRQRVLDKALAFPADAFVPIDLDFVYLWLPDFLQMFYAGWRLRAAAIAGQSMCRNSRSWCAMYDGSAIVPASALRSIVKLNCFGSVLSAHSGFTVIFAESFHSADPRPSYLTSCTGGGPHRCSDGQHINEHVPLNMALSLWGQKHGHPFLVDPRFRPIYNWGESV